MSSPNVEIESRHHARNLLPDGVFQTAGTVCLPHRHIISAFTQKASKAFLDVIVLMILPKPALLWMTSG